ncbi:MAG TPA: tripartite tricarboxylate transporter substrate binding protein [Beijerinckiaceae bacterium]
MSGIHQWARAGIACFALAGSALAWSAGPAQAQTYPERPIRFVLGFPPGSGGDLLARWFSAKMAEVSGATVIVENKPGAGGNLANEYVAKAKPDGHTLLFGGAAGLAAGPYLYKSLPFDAAKDFTPVTSVAELVFALTVPADGPKDVAELARQVKAKGAKATYGWAVTTSIASAVLFLKDAQLTEVTQVTYKTTPATVSDVAAKQVDFAFADVMYALGQEKAGKVKILATTGPRRPSAAPDAPTMMEAGYRSVDMAPWWAVFAPTGTPAPVIDKLEGWLNAVVESPATREFLVSQGADPLRGDRASVARRLKADDARWKEVTSLAKMQPM